MCQCTFNRTVFKKAVKFCENGSCSIKVEEVIKVSGKTLVDGFFSKNPVDGYTLEVLKFTWALIGEERFKKVFADNGVTGINSIEDLPKLASVKDNGLEKENGIDIFKIIESIQVPLNSKLNMKIER